MSWTIGVIEALSVASPLALMALVCLAASGAICCVCICMKKILDHLDRKGD